MILLVLPNRDLSSVWFHMGDSPDIHCIECPVCKHFFTPTSRFKKFCSETCYDNRSSYPKNRIVKKCNKTYIQYNMKLAFCSTECSDQPGRYRYDPVVCKTCNGLFIPRSPKSIFCSTHCMRGNKPPPKNFLKKLVVKLSTMNKLIDSCSGTSKWKKTIKAISKITPFIPSSEDSILSIIGKTFSAIDVVQRTFSLSSHEEATKIVEKSGGILHPFLSSFVLEVVKESKSREEWTQFSTHEIDEDSYLVEFRHETLGRAWVFSWDKSLDDSFHSDAWLEKGVTPEDLSSSLWHSMDRKIRVHMRQKKNNSTKNPGFFDFKGYDGKLYGDGHERLNFLIKEQTEANDYGEGRVYLLAGPPGTGKSTLVSKFSDHFQSNLLCIDGSVLSADLLLVLDTIKYLNPGVILFDDIDRNLPADISQFLYFMSSFRDSNPGKSLFFTVNDRSTLPRAFVRAGRIDEYIVVDFPNLDQRRIVLTEYINFYKINPNQDFSPILEVTGELGEVYLKDAVRRLRTKSVEEVAKFIKTRKEFEECSDE
jgi:hypothetical protein